MNTELHFSSKTDLWATPQDFFDKVNEEFDFTLDACALPENAKCQNFYTPEMDGLKQPWIGRVWFNPPYGEPQHACKKNCKKKKCLDRGYHNDTYKAGIVDFVSRAREAALKGDAEVVVGLLPARTDTKWFHNYIYGCAEIRFIKGRLKFGGSSNSAPFPSMLAIWWGLPKIIDKN